MRNLIATLCLTLAVLLGSVGMSASADFQRGLSAHDRGDYATALQEWTPLAEQGHATAQYNLGVMYAEGQGVPQDYKTAVKWWKLAAEQGDAAAQLALGRMYINGWGVTRDDKEAVKWMRRSADQGWLKAQQELGRFYELRFLVGKVKQDAKKAVKWMRKAAEQGGADDQHKLAWALARESVAQDPSEALEWYRKSAEQGHVVAQFDLGEHYRTGDIFPRDYKTAVKWFKRAAEQGFERAQHNLGAMYYQGLGVPRNSVLAYKWLILAAASGSKNSVEDRDQVARYMSRPELARAEDLASRFVPKKEQTPGGSRSNPDPKDNEVVTASSGTGFSVSPDGHVITNHHVIEGCQKVKIHHNGKTIPAIVVTHDSQNDLALLKGDFRPSTSLALSADSPELLQDVYVAGFPFGHKVSTGVKVTKGIISSLTGIGNNFSQIQIDAALQPGNSGGPILDDKGNVVGVAVARLDKVKTLKKLGSLPENTNFGIKTSVVRSILESNNISSRKPNTASISKTKLGKMISDGTYYLSCWMTTAQIEKMRSKKVIFQNLD
jgi:TPR repeat protein